MSLEPVFILFNHLIWLNSLGIVIMVGCGLFGGDLVVDESEMEK